MINIGLMQEAEKALDLLAKLWAENAVQYNPFIKIRRRKTLGKFPGVLLRYKAFIFDLSDFILYKV